MSRHNAWFAETAKSIYRPDFYQEAAKMLVAEGKAKHEDFPWDSDGYRAPTAEFIDAIAYDGHTPNAYLEALTIGLKGDQRIDGAGVTN